MDLNTVFTKTAKGVTQVNQRTQSLSRELTRVLKAIDGKSTVEEIAKRAEVTAQIAQKSLGQLQRDGFTKVFEVRIEVPLTDFGGDDDFDFTEVGKLGQSTMSFGPSPYRAMVGDQVERAAAVATTTFPVSVALATAVSAEKINFEAEKAVLENAKRAAEVETARIRVESQRLQAEAQKAQIEARARAEHEAELRAKLDVEARARRDAELRAMEEAVRAQAAAEAARKELETKLAEERKQRETFSDTRSRLTREQIEKEAEQQRALSAARARAESEAQALAIARGKAEEEAKALAVARVEAERAAKAQAEQFASAQRELRHQLKAEIEAKVRAEMEPMLRSDIEESARAEVEAAVLQEAQDEARRMLESRLEEERVMISRATDKAKLIAEDAATRMLAEQETRIRAEMEARLAAMAEENNRAEIAARKMAEAQAEASAKATAELTHRLRLEEVARQAAEAQAQNQRNLELHNRTRLEARAREEAAERVRIENELSAKLEVEKSAKVEAQARALVEQELRENAAKASQSELESARRGREEAERKAAAETKAREAATKAAAEHGAERDRIQLESESKLAEERQARAEAEQKAMQEIRAREIASREVDEQVSERKRIEREAEERIAYERRAREKAEEKARLEEEAEAMQRAHQVARLKELREHNERAEQQRLVEERNKPKKPRAKFNWLRWGSLGTIGAIALAAIALHIVPLNAMNTRLEKALAEYLHDDVSIGSLHVGFLPRPHLKVDQVNVGKLLDAKADQGKLYLEFSSLFKDQFVIDNMELQGVTISQEALQRASSWVKTEGRGKAIAISTIKLNNVKIVTKGLTIDAFDGEIALNSGGAITSASARSRDGKWTLNVKPQDPALAVAAAPITLPVTGAAPPVAPVAVVLPAQPESQWALDFSARNIVMPMGAPIPVTSIDAKGTLSGQELNFNEFNALLLEGTATGKLRAEWKQTPNFTSNFTVQRIKVDKLAEIFTRDIALTGRLQGDFTASSTTASVGDFLAKPNIQGTYVVRDGAIGNIDLVQAMRTPDAGPRGGQSKFSELNGQLRASDGVTRFEKMRLTGGILFANGTINVAGGGAISGTVGSEIRSSVAQDRAQFSVSGTVARPVFKRGG
jgi:AsmA-like C-terminal region